MASATRATEENPVLARSLAPWEIVLLDGVVVVETPGASAVEVGDGATVVEVRWPGKLVVAVRGGSVTPGTAAGRDVRPLRTISGETAAITPVTNTIAATTKAARTTAEDGFISPGR